MSIAGTDMRDAFFDEVLALARKDQRLVFLTGDMGAFSLEEFKRRLPERFINVGVAEQALIDVAAGLALDGRKAFAYGIATFAVLRCFEQIKVNLSDMGLPVTVVGAGAGYTYGADGPTHHAVLDLAAMRSLPGMTVYHPSDARLSQAVARMAHALEGPSYVRVERGRLPDLYGPDTDFSKGFVRLSGGADLTILASGYMVHTALAAAALLAPSGVRAGVVDVFRIKPLDEAALFDELDQGLAVATLEENCAVGGLGDAVAGLLAAREVRAPFVKLSLPDAPCHANAEREHLLACQGLDAAGVAKTLLNQLA